jgi:hypothetical protein
MLEVNILAGFTSAITLQNCPAASENKIESTNAPVNFLIDVITVKVFIVNSLLSNV